MHDNMKHVAVNLYMLRLAKRLSQTELADDLSAHFNCDISQSTISRIEAGKLEPAGYLLLHLADYFGVHIEALFATPAK